MSGSREKLRAVFLAFVMVLSVFGGTVALTGSTAATADTVQITSSTPASSGQAITFDAGVSNLNTDLQVYVDADENGDLGFGETKIEVPANAEEISVSDPGSSVTADAKSVAQVGSVNALIAEDTSGGDSTVTIAADSADSLTGGDNINTVTDIQNSETTRLGSTPSPSASVSGAPTQVSTFTFNVDINDDANLNEGEILLFGGSTLSGASTVGIAGEGTSGESGTTTFTIIANSAPSGGDAVHRVDTNIDDTSDTNFDVNGDQTVFGSSNTVTDTITPTNADDSAIISVQQTSSLTPSGTNTPDASTNSFTIIEALAGTGDSSSQVNYEIGSGNSEQTLIFGNANNSVNLLQFQDATDDSAFSGSVTLKLPQGVTVNNSASDLNPNTVIGTGSLSGEINSVSVSNNNREVTIDLAASSDTGDKIRFTGGSLVVDVDPTQFNTRGGSDNFDLGAVQFDHSLGQVSIDNPDLFNANQLNPGTTITGSLSVNQNGQALSQSSSIDLDNVDAGAIGNGTAIEVRLNNGVTFDESIAGDDIVPAGTDIDGDNTDELNTSAVTVNGDTLTIPISDPVDSNDNTIDFDVGFDQGLSVDGGQLDASGNDLTPGDVIADIGDDSEPAIVDQTVADGNSPTTIDVARDQPADFDDNDDIDLITGFSGQSDTDQDIAGSSATEFGADESSITLTADGDLPEISSGNLIAISSDTTASTSDTFVIALEAGTSDSEIAVTGASQTSFSAGDNILVVDPAANVGSSTDTDLEINGGSQNIDSSDPIRFNTTGGAQDPNVNISIEATAVSNGPFQISDSSGSATLSSALTVNSPQVDLNPSNGDVNVLAGADARLVQDSSKNVEIDLTSASVPANTFINVTTNNSAVTFDALDVGGDGSGLTYTNLGPSDINNVSVSSDGSTLAIGVGGSAIGGSGETIDVPISADDVNNVNLDNGGSNYNGDAGDIAAIGSTPNFVVQEASLDGGTERVAGVGGTTFPNSAPIDDASFSGSDTGVDLSSARQGGSSGSSNHYLLNADGDLPTSISEGDVLAVSSDQSVNEGSDTMAIALEDVGSSQSTIRVAADDDNSFSSGENILTAGASAAGGSTNSVNNGPLSITSAFGLSVGSSVADETNVQLNLTVGPVENSDTNDVLVLDKPNTAFNKDGGSAANKTLSVDNDGLQGVEIGDNSDDDGALNIDFDDVDGHGEAGTFVNVTLESDTGVTFDTRKDSSATTADTHGSNDDVTDVSDTGSTILDTSNNISINEKNIGIGINSDISSGDSIDIDELFVNATSDATNTTVSVTVDNGDNRVTTEVDEIIVADSADPNNVFGDADISENIDDGKQSPAGVGDDNFGPTGNNAAQDGESGDGDSTGTAVGNSVTGSVFVKDGGSGFGGATVDLELIDQPSGSSFSSAEVLNTTRITTASDGTADFEFTAQADAEIGTYTVNASTSTGGVNMTYEVVAGSASVFNVTGVNNSVVDQSGLSGSPGENETAAFEVRIEDSGGNLVGTQAVDVNVQVEGGELQTVTPDIANDGTSSGTNINDQNDNDRRDYQPGSRHSGDPVKGDFYVFASSTSPGDINVSVSEGGVSDSGTATVFDAIDTVEIDVNKTTVVPDETIGVTATAVTSDGTTVEVPRNPLNDFSSSNTTVLQRTSLSEEAAGGTFANGTVEATFEATGLGNATVNVSIASNQATESVTVAQAASDFQVSNISPDGANVTAGDEINVTADVENTGTTSGTQTVGFRLDTNQNGTLEASEELVNESVTLDAGNSTTVEFENVSTAGLNITGQTAHGVFSANDSATATITVQDEPASDPVERFDTNGEPGIQDDEVLNAISAFNEGEEGVEAGDVLDVISAFNEA